MSGRRTAVRTVIERAEEWHALNVIPMKVRYEYMCGEWPFAEFAVQFVSEHTKAGAAVEDEDLVSDPHFDAGGIASVAHVLGLWSRRGTAHAPKLHSHMSSVLAQFGGTLPKMFILLGIYIILATGYPPTSDESYRGQAKARGLIVRESGEQCCDIYVHSDRYNEQPAANMDLHPRPAAS